MNVGTMKLLWPFCIFCAFFTISSSEAAVFYAPGVSTTGMGKAGVSVLSSKDASALWYNPAMLTNQPTQFTLNISGIKIDNSFYRSCPCVLDNPLEDADIEENFYKITSEKPGYIIPLIGITYPTFIDNLTLGFGIYDPHTSVGVYPKDGPQRYSPFVGNNFLELHAQLAAAYQFNKKLQLGFGIEEIWDHIEIINSLETIDHDLGYIEKGNSDLTGRITADNIFSTGFTFGVVYHLFQNMQIGASYMSKHTLEGKGNVHIEKLPDFASDFKITVKPSPFQSVLPAIYRAGILYHLFSQSHIELNYVLERWSEFFIKAQTGDFDIQGIPKGFSFEVKQTEIPFDRNFKDSHAFGISAESNITNTIMFRSGYLYELSSISREYMDVLAIDLNKHVIGIGATFDNDSLQYDFALMTIFMPDITITNSKVSSFNIVDPDYTSIIGNGKYHSFIYSVSAGIRYIL